MLNDKCPTCGQSVPAVTALERAVVEAAIEEIDARWENVVAAIGGDKDKLRKRARLARIASGSTRLRDSIADLLNAREAQPDDR